MSNEEWKLQVSFKTPAGSLINVRAGTGAELAILLGDVSEEELATQISSIEAKLGVAHSLAPLEITRSTPEQTHTQSLPAVSVAPVSDIPVGPTCVHGPRKYRTGKSGPNSKVPGTPYTAWDCPMPKGLQCETVWGK